MLIILPELLLKLELHLGRLKAPNSWQLLWPVYLTGEYIYKLNNELTTNFGLNSSNGGTEYATLVILAVFPKLFFLNNQDSFSCYYERWSLVFYFFFFCYNF